VSDRVFVDTLFVVALINQRDEYHAKASELADLYEKQPLLTTDVVLLEIGNALARNFKRQAIEVIDDLLGSSEVEIVRLNPQLFDRAYALYKQYQDKEWGLLDCVSFVVMRDAGVNNALTFDQHFAQAGFQALMRE
jgi:predicted nucleic acid-binding protein